MAFLRCAKPIRYQNPYRQRLGLDLLLRRVRKLQDRSPSACCSRGYESRCGLRIANRPRLKVTKRCQSETSRTTKDGKFSLADGLSRIAQCFANILDLEVGISIQDFRLPMPSPTMPTTVATSIRRPRMQGRPPIWLGSTVTRVKVFTATSV